MGILSTYTLQNGVAIHMAMSWLMQCTTYIYASYSKRSICVHALVPVSGCKLVLACDPDYM